MKLEKLGTVGALLATDEAAGRSVRKQPAPLVAADRFHVDASLAGKTRKELNE